jgi:hypothetical protein
VIVEEVWEQLKRSINAGGNLLADGNRFGAFLDNDIQHVQLQPSNETNLEPLLVNDVGTLGLRPEASTRIPNLFLAADYIRTYTDLATMEGANEAARRAVNRILSEAGSTDSRCAVWPLYEPLVFAPLRFYDRIRFTMGLPWNESPDSILDTMQHMAQSPSSVLKMMTELPRAANRAALSLLPGDAGRHVHEAQRELWKGLRSMMGGGAATPQSSPDAMVMYHFVDHWFLEAPIKRVWDLLDDINGLHTWWPGVQAQILGSEARPQPSTITEWHMKGFLPYVMHFWIIFTKISEPTSREFKVFGDLVGTGSWKFQEIDGGTLNTLTWDVGTTHRFLETLSHLPAAKRLMEMNHEYMMQNGEAAAIATLKAPGGGKKAAV